MTRCSQIGDVSSRCGSPDGYDAIKQANSEVDAVQSRLNEVQDGIRVTKNTIDALKGSDEKIAEASPRGPYLPSPHRNGEKIKQNEVLLGDLRYSERELKDQLAAARMAAKAKAAACD